MHCMMISLSLLCMFSDLSVLIMKGDSEYRGGKGEGYGGKGGGEGSNGGHGSNLSSLLPGIMVASCGVYSYSDHACQKKY